MPPLAVSSLVWPCVLHSHGSSFIRHVRDLAKEHWEKVTTAANELREAFDKVHLSIDNKVDPDFTSVEQQMDARIGELEAIAQ